ncbi:MAG: DUF4838 domain-containing protein [Fibrobacteraceae bacterium]
MLFSLPVFGGTTLSQLGGADYGTENPWNAKAAQMLTRYAGQMTGGKTSSARNIYLGRKAVEAGLVSPAEWKKLGKGGYIVVLRDDKAGIAGNADGVLFGVRALLNRYGLKYYARGCVRFPETPVGLDPFTISETPANFIRLVTYNFQENEEKKGFPTIMLGFSPDFEQDKLSVQPGTNWKNPEFGKAWYHTACAFVTKEEFLKTHPEYFAKNPDGTMKQRNVRGRGYQLCYSNPDVQNLLDRRFRKYIEASPEGELFVLGFGDTWEWDESPESKKLDPFPIDQHGHYKNMMDRWLACTGWIFKKAIAEFPDKTIAAMAYFSCEAPPVREKPPKELAIIYCPCGFCSVHSLECPKNREVLTNLLAWRKSFPDNPLVIFDYPMNYTARWMFFFPLDGMNEKMRFYESIGSKGIVYCGVPTLFTDLFLYEQGLLAWNPKLPESELKKREDEFMNVFYGKAAPAMKEYLQLVREQTRNHCMAMYSRVSSLADRNYAEKAYRIFAQAEQSAAGDPAVLKRVEREKLAGLVYTDATMDLIPRSGAEKLKLLKELVELSRSAGLVHPGDTPWNQVVEKFNVFIAREYSPHSKNPALREWYNDPALKPILACSTDADFERLAKEIGVDCVSRVETVNSTDAIKFFPHPEKNQEYPDPAGEKRRARLLDGGASESIGFEYEGGRALTGGKLRLEGLDHDKEGTVPLEISINNKVVFSGENSFGKKKWGGMSIDIPDGLVTPGHNTLIIRNQAHAATFANWVLISSMEITPSNSPWKKAVWTEDYDKPANLKQIGICRDKGGLGIAPDPKVKFDGKTTLKITVSNVGKDSNLQLWRKVPESELPAVGTYKVTFYLKAAKMAPVRVLIFSGKTGLYNQLEEIAPSWRKLSFIVKSGKDNAGKMLEIPRLMLSGLPGNNVYFLSPPVVEAK